MAFCFLASQWQHSKSKHFLLGNSSAKAAIAFAFFSVPVWVRTSPGTPLGWGGRAVHLVTRTRTRPGSLLSPSKSTFFGHPQSWALLGSSRPPGQSLAFPVPSQLT